MRKIRRLHTIAVGLAFLGLLVLLGVAVRLFIRPIPALALLVGLALVFAGLRLLRRRVPRRTILELDLERGVVERIPREPIGRALATGSLVLRDVTDAL
ncbi:MAG: hypothetical protein ACE5KX_03215, partial [Acidimicrobiia bacterium]